jgi:hypothetical protein
VNMVRTPALQRGALVRHYSHLTDSRARLTHERDQVEKVPNLNGSEAKKGSDHMSGDDLQCENSDLRELLWLHHRPTEHCMPFGDGGEMQCGGVDFQRDSIDTLSKHVKSL